MQIAFLVLLGVLGACFGSFLCCQARRMRLKEKKKKPLGKRSVCMSCGYQLKWYDNLPIFSWVMLRGRCRKCKKKIGSAEILAEVGMMVAFVMTGVSFNATTATAVQWGVLVLSLILMLVLGFLAIYDGLYGELPTVFLILAIAIAIFILGLKEWNLVASDGFSFDLIWRPLLSVVIVAGPYLLLYLISRGKWVGDGDWLLGIAIALVLFEPFLALVALCVANLLACIVMYPSVIKKKNHKIYFGPFMVIGFVIVFSLSDILLSLLN